MRVLLAVLGDRWDFWLFRVAICSRMVTSFSWIELVTLLFHYTPCLWQQTSPVYEGFWRSTVIPMKGTQQPRSFSGAFLFAVVEQLNRIGCDWCTWHQIRLLHFRVLFDESREAHLQTGCPVEGSHFASQCRNIVVPGSTMRPKMRGNIRRLLMIIYKFITSGLMRCYSLVKR